MNSNLRYIRLFALPMVLAVAVLATACDNSSDPDPNDPNMLGGETNLEMTNPGQRFDAFVDLSDWIPAGYDWQDSIIVTKRDNGVVTMDVHIKMVFKSMLLVWATCLNRLPSSSTMQTWAIHGRSNATIMLR